MNNQVGVRLSIVSAFCVLFLSSCSSNEQILLKELTAELDTAENDTSFSQEQCTKLSIEHSKVSGQASLAEWDMAAAANIDNVSKSQEWEIRKAIGQQMGLGPSEVNGWKDIYRARAQQAKRAQDAVKSEINRTMLARDEACKTYDTAQSNVSRLKMEVRKLKRVVDLQG